MEPTNSPLLRDPSARTIAVGVPAVPSGLVMGIEATAALVLLMATTSMAESFSAVSGSSSVALPEA